MWGATRVHFVSAWSPSHRTEARHGGMPVRWRRRARLLESLGHHVEAADGRIMASETDQLAMATVIAAGVARDILEWEERLGIPVDQLEPMSEAMLEGGRSITAIQLINATNELARWSRQIAVATAPFDLVLTPTLAIVPPKLASFRATSPSPIRWPPSGP